MTLNLTSPADVRALLTRYGIVPRKSLGQHFLVAAPVLDKIVGSLAAGAGDTVVEIGPGLGVLTQRLAATGASVIAVELDGRLLPVLRETLAPYRNVRVLHGDALEVDFQALAAAHGGKTPYKVAGNLPYNITGPLVARLLREPYSIERLVLMVQKEVADRFVAQPGTRDYGSLTVLVRYRTHCRVVAGVSRRCFYPPPEVASAVVQMVVREEPPAAVLDEHLFWRVVRAAFAQRRKTLKNALRAQMGMDTGYWERVLAQAGIDPQRRGETLSIGEFAALTNVLAEATGGKDDV
ncbi:MAG TPA: 16S rRNA (adenine(1518)-N(6)/adenine(1519)-N(6))-dimethyltransferase [Peptococcaceae bacterium]|nr:16S rRNA (adenine(1518)-N(6)/adenine(1519)-N(6))-dimethyltransferase [Peptococcaceae bacterium]